MSAWIDAVGSCWIALGAYTMWRDSRVLVSRPYRRGELSRARAGSGERHWPVFASACSASRLGWCWYTHRIIAWLFAGYLVVLITYDLSAWRGSRKKSKSGHAAELS